MNEWPSSSAERNPAERFPNFDTSLQDFMEGKLDLNEVQNSTKDIVTIKDNPDTWTSSNRTNPDGSFTLSIGLKAIPQETLNKWKWGTKTDAEQYLVKLSHEFAHVVQNSFDGDLLTWLDTGNLQDSDKEPYLLLYSLLDALRGVHGLSKEGIYDSQNQSTGRLDVPVYEDLAETMGSFLIGKEYMLWRLKQSEVEIPQETIEAIEQLLQMIVAAWKKIQAQTTREG